MICFKVGLNGKHLATAGLPGRAVVTAIATWVRKVKEADEPAKEHRGPPPASRADQLRSARFYAKLYRSHRQALDARIAKLEKRIVQLERDDNSPSIVKMSPLSSASAAHRSKSM